MIETEWQKRVFAARRDRRDHEAAGWEYLGEGGGQLWDRMLVRIEGLMAGLLVAGVVWWTFWPAAAPEWIMLPAKVTIGVWAGIFLLQSLCWVLSGTKVEDTLPSPSSQVRGQ